MDDRAICLAFLKNPSVYPDNPNKGLRRGYGPFNSYVDKCRKLGYNKEIDELLTPVNPFVPIKTNVILIKTVISPIKLIPIPVPRKTNIETKRSISPTKTNTSIHGLLTKQDVVTLTGNINVDEHLLSYVDTKTLNRSDVNAYTKQILDDQKFW